MFQVKNALVKSAYCMTDYTFCSLFLRTVQSTADLGIGHFTTDPPRVKIPTRRNCAVPSTTKANCNITPWTLLQSSLGQVTLKLKFKNKKLLHRLQDYLERGSQFM